MAKAGKKPLTTGIGPQHRESSWASHHPKRITFENQLEVSAFVSWFSVVSPKWLVCFHPYSLPPTHQNLHIHLKEHLIRVIAKTSLSLCYPEEKSWEDSQYFHSLQLHSSNNLPLLKPKRSRWAPISLNLHLILPSFFLKPPLETPLLFALVRTFACICLFYFYVNLCKYYSLFVICNYNWYSNDFIGS